MNSISRKNCYIVSAGDLQNRYSTQEESGKRMTPGLLIGCHIDTSTGLLSFTVNGQEAANKFQVSITQTILTFLVRSVIKLKVKLKDLYSGFIVIHSRRSGMAHTVLPANYTIPASTS